MNVIGMLAGTASAGIGLLLIETNHISLAWPWLLLIGTMVTAGVAGLFKPVAKC
jgi:hypothetical protein